MLPERPPLGCSSRLCCSLSLCLQPHVLPEHLFFPLEPGIEDVERPVGVLAVTVMQADDVSASCRRRRRCCCAAATMSSLLPAGVPGAACAPYPAARCCLQGRLLSLVYATRLQVPKPGLLGAARPMLELFVRDSQRRQTHVAPLAGGAAAWGSRFEFPVSLPGGCCTKQHSLPIPGGPVCFQVPIHRRRVQQ